jgi:hypothetical protein
LSGYRVFLYAANNEVVMQDTEATRDEKEPMISGKDSHLLWIILALTVVAVVLLLKMLST